MLRILFNGTKLIIVFLFMFSGVTGVTQISGWNP